MERIIGRHRPQNVAGDQGEAENPLQSCVFREHNASITVSGPLQLFHVEGHNNQIVLRGLIRKLVLSGHNNQIAAESPEDTDETVVESFVIVGHNNSIDTVPCDRLVVNGHNNTVMVTDCSGVTINGINNSVYNNGTEVRCQSQRAPRPQVRGISVSMPGMNVDLEGDMGNLGVEISSYVQGVLAHCGLDLRGVPSQSQEVDEEEDPEEDPEYSYDNREVASPEPEEEVYVQDEEEEEEPRELTPEERHEIINAFPVHNYVPGNEKSDTCSICLEKLRRDERMRTLRCMHAFHQRCVDQWLEGNLICPLCRKPLIVQSDSDHDHDAEEEVEEPEEEIEAPDGEVEEPEEGNVDGDELEYQ